MTDHLTETDRVLLAILDGPFAPSDEHIMEASERIRELSRQLHAAEAQLQAKEDGLKVRDRRLAAAEADAARLAEAGESCAEDLEAEVRDRWGYDERLERQLRRDMRPVVEFREALAAHTARLING